MSKSKSNSIHVTVGRKAHKRLKKAVLKEHKTTKGFLFKEMTIAVEERADKLEVKILQKKNQKIKRG